MEAKKRIYIGLLFVSLIIIVLTGISVVYIFNNRGLLLSKILLVSLAVIAILIIIILGTGILALIIMIIRSRTSPSMENIMRVANDVLFPFTLLIGKLLGIKKEKILRSYIEVNNNLVKSKKIILNGKQVLILLPHCLQNSECPHKITMDVSNCKRCGKCTIGDLVKIAEKFGANLKVATGGTLARKFIKEIRPKAVIAVACERDLSSGIHDMVGIPVIGVLNSRPNGPCFNTTVDIDRVEEVLIKICEGG